MCQKSHLLHCIFFSGLKTKAVQSLNGQCSDWWAHTWRHREGLVQSEVSSASDTGDKILIMHNAHCHSEDRAWCWTKASRPLRSQKVLEDSRRQEGSVWLWCNRTGDCSEDELSERDKHSECHIAQKIKHKIWIELGVRTPRSSPCDRKLYRVMLWHALGAWEVT